VTQKNEKDIKQIGKIDLANYKGPKLDRTMEEPEDLEQQLRAAQAQSHAQSRSQSYAASRLNQELQSIRNEQESSEDSDAELHKMQMNSKRNIPSSTYHQITGEELRNELFFKQRGGNKNRSDQNEYFSYKEMVQMYQAEIKRRWDTRA
jgi:hypothetical protein